jgi:hypothetical protein
MDEVQRALALIEAAEVALAEAKRALVDPDWGTPLRVDEEPTWPAFDSRASATCRDEDCVSHSWEGGKGGKLVHHR